MCDTGAFDGFALSPGVLDNLAKKGTVVHQCRWRYGDAFRSHPFPPHRRLAGTFTTPNGRAGGYFPGDHKGCLCSLVPVLCRLPNAPITAAMEANPCAPPEQPQPTTPTTVKLGGDELVNVNGQKVPARYVTYEPDGEITIDYTAWVAETKAEKDRLWGAVEDGRGTLTTDQARSVGAYQSAFGNYHEINGSLRAGKVAEGASAEHIVNIDAAMSQSVLKERITSWRSVNFGTKAQAKAFTDDLVEGGTFSDPAYFSTSIDQTKANQWLGKADERSVSFRLEVPAGQNYVALTDEAEVLLPRATRWRVKSRTTHELGFLEIVMEVAP